LTLPSRRASIDPAPVCPRVIDELTPNHRNSPGRPHHRRIQHGLAAGDRAARGFCGAGLLVNRGSGRAVSSVTYDGPGRDPTDPAQAATVRAADTQDARAEVAEVKEFELAIGRLRVPEMA
jgi:hypothetical protein